MRRFSLSSLLLFILYSAAFALSVRTMTLQEAIQESDLVVVGSFKDTKGRADSRIAGPKFEWNADLDISEVLKGSPVEKVFVSWLELHSDSTYNPPVERIWVLRKQKEGDTYYVMYSHGSLPISQKRQIVELIANHP